MQIKKKPEGYEVTWSTVVEAESIMDAARQAFGMMRDENDTSTFLRVTNINTGKSVFEDFEELYEAKYIAARWFVDAFTFIKNRIAEDVCEITVIEDTEDGVEVSINLEEGVNFVKIGEIIYHYYKDQSGDSDREEEEGWNTLVEASKIIDAIKRAQDFGYEKIVIKSEY